MSQIHAVTQRDEAGNAHCTLSLPQELLDRLNSAEDRLGEQSGAQYRDRVLQVLAAMVISSIDSFRVSDLSTTVSKREGELPIIEGTSNGDASRN